MVCKWLVSGSGKSFYKVVLRVLTLLCICVCGLKRVLVSPQTPHTFVTFWANFLSFSSAWFCCRKRCRCCGGRHGYSKVLERLLLDPSSLFSLLTSLLSGGCCCYCYIFRLKKQTNKKTIQPHLLLSEKLLRPRCVLWEHSLWFCG